MKFDEFFRCATGVPQGPYPYQNRLACAGELPTLINIPTGLGKTAAVILAWMWRRLFASDAVRQATPRRLVYCLPMRTLVEQTERAALKWIDNVAEQVSNLPMASPSVHVLMGGAETTDWDAHPEQNVILIGTQDMLLSRALNRGYGMSRYRWPVHFALLNNDCLWVVDETQLMGVGLTTSAQLQGFRNKLNTYGITRSLWMSATMDEDLLSTVDHPQPYEGWDKLQLGDKDRASKVVLKLIEATKPCRQADVTLTPDNEKHAYHVDLARQITESHRPGTLTLAVVNQVERAQRVFDSVRSQLKGDRDGVELFLIHSRFRKCDRDEHQQTALDDKTISPNRPGRIVIATQAIEAGVDVSATTLFTELAPWPSLVQRFGRCNRRGACDIDGKPSAQVFWVDVDTSDAARSKVSSLPYSIDEMNASRKLVETLSDAGPQTLERVLYERERPVLHTLRCKDVIELWDTTPDLAGNDLDVSRYIRDSDDTDVQFYWRQWDQKATGGTPPAPRNDVGELVFPPASREELCSVSLGRARDFVKKVKNGTWRWDPLEADWRKVGWQEVRSGMILLLHVEVGGYDPLLGWTGNGANRPNAKPSAMNEGTEMEAMSGEALGSKPVLLAEHLQQVTHAAETLQGRFGESLDGIPWESIITAAQWHDVGKAHVAFQNAVRDFVPVVERDPGDRQVWAKSGAKGVLDYRIVETDDEGKPRPKRRPGFRHELASALAWLAQSDGMADADLIAFLIAAHHGKVRASIRSMPNENYPNDAGIRFARGLWEGDQIPPVSLGDDSVTRRVDIDLALMELGGDEQGRPSWFSRVLKLRDEYGPFRLSYLETLVRIADWCGSNNGGESDG